MSVVTVLVREGCPKCDKAVDDARALVGEAITAPSPGSHELTELKVVDVDEAASTDPTLRAEFGDRLPVILLDGAEHGYWEVDVPRLRADLAARS